MTVLVSEYEGKRLNSTNDVTVRSDGLILFTDPKPLRGAEELPLDFGGVYSFEPETRTLKLLSSSLKFPNGIGLSPDERTLYVSSTTGGNIMAFDLLEDGTVENERVFCDVRIPDGMAVDTEGNIWSSSSGGISVFDASGAFLERIRIPIMPTNCAFGGADGSILYVTARKKVFRIKTRYYGQGEY
ncbi:MAG: hypothetical protein COA73_08080 [Candidatus Hydrogenedentota bacterium]|nr:MAG: hypothetical protein COA73_08080 [Candidatus Hydrogenedentota bacterium]